MLNSIPVKQFGSLSVRRAMENIKATKTHLKYLVIYSDKDTITTSDLVFEGHGTALAQTIYVELFELPRQP